MAELRFTPAALADIESIYDFTLERWGLSQAERYLLQLRDACNDLANGKRRGRDASDIRTGYRKQPCGSHIIFYRYAESSRIEIVRVLHQAMDLETRLSD